MLEAQNLDLLFHQFSSPVTKFHGYQAICTLSPLDAVLKIRFASAALATQNDDGGHPKVPHLRAI